MAEAWAGEVLGFWFGLSPEQWWRDNTLDGKIAERFDALWEEQQGRPVADFLTDQRQALAAIILFDQFPRNMFRDHAQSFATDHIALEIARGALDRGYDGELSADELTFLAMPFQHSESLSDQQRSLAIFTAIGDPVSLRAARLHHDVIERFGRFPHRNAILGRAPRDEEIAAGNVTPW